ncbi:MAG: SDR family NAD(P)-dependent oxidoreductase [Caulobacteraceae bacterium]|nr:SDR family NAD(P)-dependent oxidoreductase [Caulobacteraceae bacterium]
MALNLELGHAVVTGGGGGIGLATARALAARGHAVTVMGRSRAPLEAAAAMLGGGGFAVCDVTDEASVASALAEAEGARGPVRVLVNNAGAVTTAPFEKTSLEAWSAALDVNLLGAVRMTRAALPSLKAQAWARVVNIASTAGLKPYAYVSPYVASKHALVGFTRALALELATSGVTVNAVCPGYTRTAIIERAIETIAARTGRDADAAEAVFTGSNPQGRLVAPDEVATAVTWLASADAGAVNGVALSVSGGETG